MLISIKRFSIGFYKSFAFGYFDHKIFDYKGFSLGYLDFGWWYDDIPEGVKKEMHGVKKLFGN